MYGDDFHPILKMAENANRLQTVLETIPEEDKSILFVGLKTSIDAWDKIAQYTEPKLKAVEMKIEGELSILGNLTDDELRARAKELAHAAA